MKDSIKEYWLFACWIANQLSFGLNSKIKYIHTEFVDTLRCKTSTALAGWFLFSLLGYLISLVGMMVYYNTRESGLEIAVSYFSAIYIPATLIYLIYCGLQAAWTAYQKEQTKMVENLRRR